MIGHHQTKPRTASQMWKRRKIYANKIRVVAVPEPNLKQTFTVVTSSLLAGCWWWGWIVANIVTIKLLLRASIDMLEWCQRNMQTIVNIFFSPFFRDFKRRLRRCLHTFSTFFRTLAVMLRSCWCCCYFRLLLTCFWVQSECVTLSKRLSI